MTSQSLNTSAKPTFKGFSEATGHTSLLSDSSEEKLNTFGWKVTTNEESYSSDTLIGNWNEEKFDIKSMSRSKPLPSQYSHYFESTYSSAYNKPKAAESKVFKQGAKEPQAFPGHQPLLDPPTLKDEYSSFLTASREAYGTPENATSKQLKDSLT